MRQHRIIRAQNQRIAWTNTSRLDDDDVADIIRFVMQYIDIDGTVIHFKGSGARSRRWGRAYNGMPSIANLAGLNRDEWSYLVVVSDHFQGHVTADMVDTLAHEAKHIEQFKLEQPIREAPCRAFGGWVARQWSAAHDYSAVEVLTF